MSLASFSRLCAALVLLSPLAARVAAQPVLPVPKQAGSLAERAESQGLSSVQAQTLGDAFVQTAKISSSDGMQSDAVASSVSISGTRALVGAYAEDSGGTTAGAAYVFEETAGGWVQTAKLTASDASNADAFGWSVSLDGDHAVIGAVLASSGFNNGGAAYIFDLSGGVWSETAKLIGSNQNSGFFGGSVAIEGDRVLVGEYNSGLAFVFDLTGGAWNQTQQLSGSDTDPNDRFGYAVALSGDRALIGAYQKTIVAGGNREGAAYVFDLAGGTWSETQRLTASDASAVAIFGFALDLDGDRALIGAQGEGSFTGSAYVFDLTAGTWTETQKILPTGLTAGQRFGFAVSLSGDRALVGSPSASVAGGQAGIAHLFDLVGGTWQQAQQFLPSDLTTSDTFGRALDLAGDRLIVGAPSGDVGGVVGIGAGYLFDLQTAAEFTGPEGWLQVAASGGMETFGTFLDLIWTQGYTGSDAPTAQPNVYLYDETVDGDEPEGYAAITSAATTFTPGTGAFVYVYADDDNDGTGDPFPKLFPLYGAEPSRPFTFSVSYTDNGDGGPDVGLDTQDDGWNLLGNPFRTPFDYEAVWSSGGSSTGGTSTNMDPFVHVFEPTAGYVFYNANTNTGTLTNGLVPVGSGFYVRANAANPALTVAGGGGQNLTANAVAPHVILRVESKTPTGREISGATLAALVEGASLGLDPDDSILLDPVQTPYVHIGLAPEATVFFSDPDVFGHTAIPGPTELGTITDIPIRLSASGVSANLRATWEVNLPPGWKAQLLDLETGKLTEMEPDTSLALAAAPEAEVSRRYMLRLTKGTTVQGEGGPLAPEALTLSEPTPNPTRGTVRVSLRAASAGNVSVRIYDALGREVRNAFEATVQSGEERMIRADTRTLAPGVYVIRARNGAATTSRRFTVTR